MFASKDLFLTQPAGAATGYQISRSVRLRSSASAYFSKTYSGSPTNSKIFTASMWLKRGKLGATQTVFTGYDGTSSNASRLEFLSGDTLNWQFGGASANNITTTQVFRDPSAWYHIVVAVDTTQATAANRQILYINGTQVTALSTANYPAQNATSQIMYANGNNAIAFGAGAYFDGYLTEINFIDGQALTPSSFGATNTTTGVWGPAKYTGTYGTNGFYLNFSDNSAATAAAIGKDSSGNGNNWTPNNISVTAGITYDSMVDTPTPYGSDTGAGGTVRGNYCVMNPVAKNSRVTSANGNLQLTGDNTANHQITYGTFPITTGKWYWEATINNPGSPVNIIGIQSYIGFADGTYCGSGGNGIGWGYSNAAGNFYASNFTTSGTAPVLSNGTIGFAYDADAGKMWFRNNTGSWVQGDPAAGTSPTGTLSGTATAVMPAVSFYVSNGAYDFNFGQRAFAYTAPSGYKALNTQNLSTPTIANGASYMAATTYAGNSSSQSITNTVNSASFKPDLVWVKNRSSVTNHYLWDSVRGALKELYSNLTSAEATNTIGLSAFNSNGFTLNNGDAAWNVSGSNYVGWQWLAGAGSSSSNTNGSITSTVSVNATAGFSVVTYTGTGANATVGHGLGVAPQMVIIKNRSGANGWTTYQAFQNASPASGYVQLNSTAAFTTFSLVFNNTAPTSSVFSVGTDTSTNASTNNYVAYCFAPIAGYSAFGSYTGNGSADGPFVFCGFRPRYLWIKRTNSTGNWIDLDTSRSPYNSADAYLSLNASSAEATGAYNTDILSNGFKLRYADPYGDVNASGSTYVYAAFAENPFKYSLAR